ncbi:ATP synthase subunit b 2 [soil metagenome]
MPQFELANFTPQLAWLAIFFVILYFGVVRLTLPKLGRVMTAREDQVTGDLNVAERAKAEADRITTAYDAGVAEAQNAARAKMKEAQAAATVAVEAKLASSKAALDASAATAQTALDAALQKVLGQIETVAADVASEIVEKLTGVRPATAEAAAAARATLA